MTKLSAETNKIVAFDGNERIPASDGVGTSPADGWIDPSWLDTPLQQPFYGDANVGLSAIGGGNVSNLTLTSGRLFMVPFRPAAQRTFSQLFVNVVTRAAGAGLRAAIYNANQQTRQPTTLVEDLGVVDLDSTTGVVNRNTFTVTSTLDPKLYFAAFLCNSSAAVITGLSGAGTSPCLGASLAASGTTAYIIGLSRNSVTYQAFNPNYADESAQTYTAAGVNVPFFVLR